MDSQRIRANEHQETARQLLAAALQVEASQVDLKAGIGRTERWDSLAHMRLIMLLEEHLGSALETEAMLAIESLSDVAKILGSADGASPDGET
jgi:acyl carrier protein